MVATYGWGKLGLGHRFPATAQDIRYTISEPVRRQARARLLELNHVRYAEEAAAGLHDKKKGRGVRCASRASTVRERDEGCQPSLDREGEGQFASMRPAARSSSRARCWPCR
jgi:hypothetical protein